MPGGIARDIQLAVTFARQVNLYRPGGMTPDSRSTASALDEIIHSQPGPTASGSHGLTTAATPRNSHGRDSIETDKQWQRRQQPK